MVNRRLDAPKPPHDKVNAERCTACNEDYENYNAHVTFEAGVQFVRAHNADTDGGYRSRGPVLWAMRVIKLSRWYEYHLYCNSDY